MSTHPGSVLHIIDTTGPGGAETIFTQLAAYTQELGCRSIALIRGPGWVEQELNRLGIETRIIDCKGSFNIRYLRRLVNIIRTEQIDLVQAHLLGSSLYASLAGILTRTPVISTFHGHVDVSPNERFRLAKFLVVQLGSRHIISVTQQLAAMLKGISTVAARKVVTIPNGIDIHAFSQKGSRSIRQDLQVPSDAILIGCLGNVRRAKNYNLAIDTLKLIIQRGLNAKLVIAGDDSNQLAKEHRQYADSLDLSNHVIWLGFYKDTPAFLNSIDVFLLSSSSEGHPLALTQAMAAGVPIVSTECGVEEIVRHRETAMIADKGDANGLADYVIEVFRDSAFRAQITAAARAQAQETFSLEAMCRRYRTLYQSFLPDHDGTANRFWLSQKIVNHYGSKRALLVTFRHFSENLISQKYKRYQKVPEDVTRVVFVCKGNICRSAVAEYAFRNHSEVPAVSIGLDTQSGKEGNARIVHYASECGIDMRAHRATAFDDFKAKPGDLFVCMEPNHINELEALNQPDQIVLLGYFGQPRKLYIHDPYSSDDTYARKCTNYIVAATKNLASQLKTT